MPVYPRCFAGLAGVAWVVRIQHGRPEVWGWSRATGFEDYLGLSEQWSETQLELSREELVGVVPPSLPVICPAAVPLPVTPQEIPVAELEPVVLEPVVTLPEPRRRHVDLTNNG